MAARTRKGTKNDPWDAKVRERIQTSMLINRLSDHVFGKVELSPTQVRSAEILLKKSMPDLSASDNKTEVTHHYVADVPAVAPTVDTWQQQHAPKTLQ